MRGRLRRRGRDVISPVSNGGLGGMWSFLPPPPPHPPPRALCQVVRSYPGGLALVRCAPSHFTYSYYAIPGYVPWRVSVCVCLSVGVLVCISLCLSVSVRLFSVCLFMSMSVSVSLLRLSVHAFVGVCVCMCVRLCGYEHVCLYMHVFSFFLFFSCHLSNLPTV